MGFHEYCPGKIVNKNLYTDRNIVLSICHTKDDMIVKCNVAVLEFCVEDLRNDKEIVLAAIRVNPYNIEFASKRLQDDDSIFVEIIEDKNNLLQYQYDCILKYMSSRLRNDKKLIEAVLNLDYQKDIVSHLSKEFQDDKELILKAVTKHINALEFASSRLKNDREVATLAVKSYGSAFKYVSREFKEDKSFVLFAVSKHYLNLNAVSENLKQDKEVIIKSVKNHGNSLQFAPTEYKIDREIVLFAVRENGIALQFASEELRSDKYIAFEALKQSHHAVLGFSQELKEEIGNNNPFVYLRTFLAHEELTQKIYNRDKNNTKEEKSLQKSKI
jgi:hypothetical protein